MGKNKELVLQGTPVSPGIEEGPVAILDFPEVPLHQEKIPQAEIPRQVRLFERARQEILRNLRELRAGLERHLADLVESQIQLLQDPYLVRRIRELIEEEEHQAEYAVYRVFDEMAQALEKSQTVYMQDRAQELRHLARDLIALIRGEIQEEEFHRLKDKVVVAPALSLKQAIQAIEAGARAFVLEGGGKTSHVAIIIKDMRRPAVFEVPAVSRKARDGELAVVDGYEGKVVLRPTAGTLERYRRQKAQRAEVLRVLYQDREKPPVTLDGVEIPVRVNLSFPEEAAIFSLYGRHGVGLMRTEVLFYTFGDDEEGQRQVYESLAETVYPDPLVIRLFDLGGDKIGQAEEANPFLGLRGVRVLFRKPELFYPQIRAILKANQKGNIRILLPLVTLPEEVDRAREILQKAAETQNRALPPLGIMVEVPSAALLIEKFLPRVDFLSIGTNDLTQYLLAADRTNPEMGGLYDHLNPVVLRVIAEVVRKASEAGVPVSVCGELASDPYGLPLLVAMGVSEVSVSPAVLLETKEMIRHLRKADLQLLLQEVLDAESPQVVREQVRTFLEQHFPDVLRVRDL